MNELAAVLRRQLAAELPDLRRRIRAAGTDEARAARCGTIGELRDLARHSLPRVIFDFVDGAAADEVTAVRNRQHFRALELLPRVLADVSEVDIATSVLGQPIAAPLLAAPMGLLGLVDPAGELALARAMDAAGSICVLGAMSSYRIEEVSQASGGPLWFQMYLWRDRGLVRELLDRARACGHRALVLTVDVPRAAGRDRDRRNGFGVPPRATVRSLVEGALHPRWARRLIREPRLQWANVVGRDSEALDAVSATVYINSQFDPSATWEDLSWFRAQWEGPLVVKGILHPEDAREAIRRGAQAISVSNHGGRQLDHAPSAISALPAIVDAVGQDAEVYLDGGIRRGSDVVKAIALGARACLLGRSLVYGLGAAGEAGVARAVEIIRSELVGTLALAGSTSIHSLRPTDVRPVSPGAGRGGPSRVQSTNQLVENAW